MQVFDAYALINVRSDRNKGKLNDKVAVQLTMSSGPRVGGH